MIIRLKSLIAGAVLAVAPISANAGIITQDSGQFDAAISVFDPIGQSFVAEDGQLGSIAFAFSDINPGLANTPIEMTLYAGAGFAGAVLAVVVQTLPEVLPSISAPPQFIDFDFTGTALTVGQIYTAAVTASSAKVAVVYAGADVYGSGQAFFTGGTPAGCEAGCDLNFRVTPGDAPVSVPEPATAALALAGLGLLSVTGRRRRRSA